MKSIQEYIHTYSIDQISNNEYYYKHLLEYFGDDIPNKYIDAYNKGNGTELVPTGFCMP